MMMSKNMISERSDFGSLRWACEGVILCGMLIALIVIACALAVSVGAQARRSRRMLKRRVTIHLVNGDAIEGLLMSRGLRIVEVAEAEVRNDDGLTPLDGVLVVELSQIVCTQVLR